MPSNHRDDAKATIAVAALDLRVHVLIEDARLRDAVRHLWAGCLSTTDGEPDQVVRVKGEEPWHVASDAYSEEAATFPAAVAGACAAVNVTLATRTPLLAVHAAVLQKNGTTIVVPAESGGGKTTLTVALLRAGWSYASDEAYALDWKSALPFAYPRPLGVSDWTAEKLGVSAGILGEGERFLRAGDLGAPLAVRPLKADHVVLLDRSAPVSEPALGNVHRAEALEKLLRQSFTHYYAAEKAVRLLADVVRGAQTWRLKYADPLDAAALLSTTFLKGQILPTAT